MTVNSSGALARVPILLVSVALLGLGTAPASAGPKKSAKPLLTEIKPAGAVWFLRQDDNRCSLRSPVIGGQAISHIEVGTGLYDGRVSGLALVPTMALDEGPRQVGVKFGSNPAQPFRAYISGGEIGAAKIHVDFAGKVPTIDLAKADSFIVGTGIETIGVVTKAIGPKLSALRDCQIARFARLGFDTSLTAAVAVAPKPKRYPMSIISSFSRPRAWSMREQYGAIDAALLVDASGKVLRCEIIVTSQSRMIDEMSCKNLLKTKFEPAKDRNGKPIRALVSHWVPWLVF